MDLKDLQYAIEDFLPGSSSSGISASCESNLYQGKAPVIAMSQLEKDSKVICNVGYAGRVSYITKSNLYSAEYLTSQRLRQARKIERVNPFHEEESISPSKRANLSDYRGSGYDRGHLAPNADMPTKESQFDSFSLANMIPQVPENNRETWSKIEQKTRYLTKKYKQLYVVTMPVYSHLDGSFPKRIKAIGKNKVYVPLYVAKAIYIPSIKQALVVVAPNDASYRMKIMSVSQFQKGTKIDAFPSLSPSIKAHKGTFFKW